MKDDGKVTGVNATLCGPSYFPDFSNILNDNMGVKLVVSGY